MLLAGSSYFQSRFQTSHWLLIHFPSAITSVSTITGLVGALLLLNLQRGASYPKRIIAALVLNGCVFVLLALSTVLFRSVSAGVYFALLMFVCLSSSTAASLCQNGVFAYVSKFGISEYPQAIMTGQAVAGVLPCIARIVSVLAAEEAGAEQEKSKSAFVYFLTATGISALALAAFLFLLKKQEMTKVVVDGEDNSDEEDLPKRKVVGMWTLFRKLRWLALAVIICFGITMLFPVFTPEIYSVRPPAEAPRLLRPDCFIPLAFLVWNVGDLTGRVLTLAPFLDLTRFPRLLFFLSIFRCGFVPLYLVCNVHNRGALINSDFFYLFFVQFLFGATNGYVGSLCMMGAARWVDPDEREAAGAFMGLMLMGGLAAGSLLSFAAN